MDAPPQDDPSPAEESDAMYGRRGCCFWINPPSSMEWWEQIRGDHQHPDSRPLWKQALKPLIKLREWSELVAGPRWKTFIRRFNRNPRHAGGSARRWKGFQYDPVSYAHNFDDGGGDDESPDREGGFRNFSSRYAALPGSMEVGGREAAPPLVAAVVD